MNANQFQITLDFLLQAKIDQKTFNKAVEVITALMKNLHPELDINADQVKKELISITNLFEDISKNADQVMEDFNKMELNLNSDQAIDDFAKLEKMSNEFMDQLQEIGNQKIEGFDMGKFDDQIKSALEESQKFVDEQKKLLKLMENDGIKGAGYDELKQKIKGAETQVAKLNDELKNSQKTSDATKGSFLELAAKFEALGQLGDSISSFSEKGIETRDALYKLQGATNMTGEALDKFKGMAEDAFKVGLGESVADSVNKLTYAKRILGETFDDTELLNFSKGAEAMAQVFDKDFNEVTANAKTLITNFGLDSQKAFELMSLGLQGTASQQDDFLDTLNEYSPLMKKAGLSAEQFVGILNNGMKAGVFNTDKLGDAIKETGIRLMEGDITTEMNDLMTRFGNDMPKGLDTTLKKIVQAGEKGKISTADVMQQYSEAVYGAFNEGQISDVLRDKLSRALAGTPAEDLGAEFSKVFSQGIDVTAIEEQAKKAGENVANALGPVTMFEKVQKEIDLLGSKLSGIFAPALAGVGSFLSSTSQIAPSISLIQNQYSSISSFVEKSGGLSKTLSMVQGGLSTATSGILKMSAAFLTSPIGLITVGLIATVAATKLLADALHKTAEEKKKDIEEEGNALNQQIKLNQQRQSNLEKENSLIKDYKKINEDILSIDKQATEGKISSAEKTAKLEAMRSKEKETLLSLAKAYPGVIDSNKSYAENLKALENASGKTISELSKLKDEMFKLQEQSIDLNIKKANIQVDVSKEEIENQLTEAFKIIGLTDAAEWLFGTSTARVTGEQLIKPYTDAIYQAKDSNELQKATMDFQMAIFNSDNFKNLSDEEKVKMVEAVDKMSKAKQEAITKSTKGIGEDIKKLTENGTQTAEVIDFISKKYGKTKEEATKIVNEQKRQTDEAKKTAAAVSDIGVKFSEALQTAQTGFNTGLEKENSLILQIKEAKKNKDNDQLSKLQKDLADTRKDNLAKDKELDYLNKTSELTNKRYENIDALEAAKKEAEIRNKNLENLYKQKDIYYELSILNAEREKSQFDEWVIGNRQLELLNRQKKVWLESLEKRKLISVVEGNVKITVDDKEKKQEINTIIADINQQIKEQQLNVKQLEINLKVQTKELEKRLLELKKQEIEFDIKLGFKNSNDLKLILDGYQSLLQESKNKFADTSKKINVIEEKRQLELEDLIGLSSEEELKNIEKQYSDKIQLHEEQTIILNQKLYDLDEKYNNDKKQKISSKARTELKKQYESDRKIIIEEENINTLEILNLQNEANQKMIDATGSVTYTEYITRKNFYDSQLNDLKSNNADQKEEIMQTEAEITDIINNIYDERLNNLNNSITKETELLQSEYDERTQSIEKSLTKIQELFNDSSQKTKDNSLKNAQDETDKKLAELDRFKELGILSLEDYENRKSKLTLKSEQERATIEARATQDTLNRETFSKTIRIENERAKDVESIKIQKKSLEEQSRILNDKLDMQIANNQEVSYEDLKALSDLEGNLDDTNKMLEFKSSLLGSTLMASQDAIGNAITAMFAGNKEAAIKSVNELFSALFGVLAKALSDKISAAILSMVLDYFTLTPTDPLVKLAISPVIYGTVSAGVHAIADPLLETMSKYSFATGGSVNDFTGQYSSPTAVLIGDGAKLGGSNKEWWLRDEQLQQTVSMAVQYKNEDMINEIKKLQVIMQNINLETKIKGEDIYVTQRRNSVSRSARLR